MYKINIPDEIVTVFTNFHVSSMIIDDTPVDKALFLMARRNQSDNVKMRNTTPYPASWLVEIIDEKEKDINDIVNTISKNTTGLYIFGSRNCNMSEDMSELIFLFKDDFKFSFVTIKDNQPFNVDLLTYKLDELLSNYKVYKGSIVQEDLLDLCLITKYKYYVYNDQRAGSLTNWLEKDPEIMKDSFFIKLNSTLTIDISAIKDILSVHNKGCKNYVNEKKVTDSEKPVKLGEDVEIVTYNDIYDTAFKDGLFDKSLTSIVNSNCQKTTRAHQAFIADQEIPFPGIMVHHRYSHKKNIKFPIPSDLSFVRIRAVRKIFNIPIRDFEFSKYGLVSAVFYMDKRLRQHPDAELPKIKKARILSDDVYNLIKIIGARAFAEIYDFMPNFNYNKVAVGIIERFFNKTVVLKNTSSMKKTNVLLSSDITNVITDVINAPINNVYKSFFKMTWNYPFAKPNEFAIFYMKDIKDTEKFNIDKKFVGKYVMVYSDKISIFYHDDKSVLQKDIKLIQNMIKLLQIEGDKINEQ